METNEFPPNVWQSVLTNVTDSHSCYVWCHKRGGGYMTQGWTIPDGTPCWRGYNNQNMYCVKGECQVRWYMPLFPFISLHKNALKLKPFFIDINVLCTFPHYFMLAQWQSPIPGSDGGDTKSWLGLGVHSGSYSILSYRFWSNEYTSCKTDLKSLTYHQVRLKQGYVSFMS